MTLTNKKDIKADKLREIEKKMTEKQEEKTYNEVAHDVLEEELTKRAEEICKNCGRKYDGKFPCPACGSVNFIKEEKK